MKFRILDKETVYVRKVRTLQEKRNVMNGKQAEPTSSLSVSVEVLESLDFTPGCEWEHPDQSLCNSDAEWLGIFTCCDDSWQVCNFHQVESEVTIAAGNNCHRQCGKDVYMDWISLY